MHSVRWDGMGSGDDKQDIIPHTPPTNRVGGDDKPGGKERTVMQNRLGKSNQTRRQNGQLTYSKRRVKNLMLSQI